jgi:hypothetical protein
MTNSLQLLPRFHQEVVALVHILLVQIHEPTALRQAAHHAHESLHKYTLLPTARYYSLDQVSQSFQFRVIFFKFLGCQSHE